MKDPRRTYRSRRLVIRPLDFADYEAWLAAQKCMLPPTDKFDSGPNTPAKQTRTFFATRVRRQRAIARKDKNYIWNIFLKSTGEHLGFIDIAPICRIPLQVANLGYFVNNHCRGQGYANEALRTIIPRALKNLKLHRLEAVIDLDNRASIAVAKSAGLAREGIRKKYFFQNGHWEDQVIFVAYPELYKPQR